MTEKKTERPATLGVNTYQDAYGHTSFRPTSKAENIAPKIIKQYYDKDKVRMYKCKPLPGSKEPRLFIAAKYDEMYLPAHDKRRSLEKLRGDNGIYRLKH